MGERIEDEDSPFYGMTARQGRGMIGRILNGSSPAELYPLRRKAALADFVENEAMNESLSIEERLLCVDKSLKMQQINLEYQKLHVQVELAAMKNEASGEEKTGGPQVVLVLPTNGSEVEA